MKLIRSCLGGPNPVTIGWKVDTNQSEHCREKEIQGQETKEKKRRKIKEMPFVGVDFGEKDRLSRFRPPSPAISERKTTRV
jgi:hypothetical protein